MNKTIKIMTEEQLHDYNKWLIEVWNPNQLYIPFVEDAPRAYLSYTNMKNKSIKNSVDNIESKNINMNITKPEQMQSGTSKIEEALSKFEKQLTEEENDLKYYHIIIVGEYNRETCDEIERIYKGAGWRKVKCKTSSENGERGGLTGLQLWI